MGYFSKSKSLYCNWRDWSGLPRNVLFDIMDKLIDVNDYVRFGAVCFPWRNVFLEETPVNKKKHCSQPFLVAACLTHKYKMVLYSLSRKRIYDVDLHLAYKFCNNHIRGSSYGWLLTIENIGTGRHYKFVIRLQNPFLPRNRFIQLPTLDSIIHTHPGYPSASISGYFSHGIDMVVLSSDPLISDEFFALAIIVEFSSLALFKSGNSEWFMIGNWLEDVQERRRYTNVIFSQKTKQFYALRKDGQVFTLDLTSVRQPKLIQALPSAGFNVNAYNNHLPPFPLLVEDSTSGELLQVYDYKDEQNTLCIVLLKLNSLQENWIQIHDLGDRIMFLSNCTSFIRSASDCPGYKPNCIYSSNFEEFYDLKEKKHLPLFSADTIKPSGECYWVECTLL